MADSSSELIPLTIERLSFHGGRGVGRHEGLVVFVPDTAPGDRILCKIVERKKRYALGRLESLVTPGPSRVPPLCPVASQCGGCTWQQVDYSEQLRQKMDLVAFALRRFLPEKGLSPIVPSPHSFFYRNRIQIHGEAGQWGFRAAKSERIVPIEKCYIAEESINQQLHDLLNTPPKKTSRRELFAQNQTDLEGVFGQVNTEVNKRLIKSVLELCPQNPKVVFDLYCGQGNFTIPLQQAWPECQIQGVESDGQAVKNARQKAGNLNLKTQFYQGKVEEHLRSLTPLADLILIDPPRSGCSKKVLERLISLKPRKIIYISCDPMTLARDLHPLTSGALYHVRQIQPFDMFPQTSHVEVLSELCLN